MSQLLFVLKYIRHWWRTVSVPAPSHGLADELSRLVFDDSVRFYFFDKVEELREELLSDERVITVTDFGAGSKVNNGKQRAVSDIAKHSAKKPELGRMLFRMINLIQPVQMLELGTSLGLSAAYQGAPVGHARFVTLEGCPATAAIAQANLDKLGLKHVQISVGSFEKTLPLALSEFTKLDYVFFDGNHTYAATMDYFHRCLPLTDEYSVFVFDDIHWSSGMERAWNEICHHEAVTLCLDLFFLGIVFFRKSEKKEVVYVRYER